MGNQIFMMRSLMMYGMVLMTVFCSYSCTRSRDFNTCEHKNGYKDAVILDTGPLASDGCGWVVRVGDDQYYHPENLDEKFWQNDLQVQVCYELTTDKFYCGIAGNPMPVIRIYSIKK